VLHLFISLVPEISQEVVTILTENMIVTSDLSDMSFINKEEVITNEMSVGYRSLAVQN